MLEPPATHSNVCYRHLEKLKAIYHNSLLYESINITMCPFLIDTFKKLSRYMR